jgi:hypothetical protein
MRGREKRASGSSSTQQTGAAESSGRADRRLQYRKRKAQQAPADSATIADKRKKASDAASALGTALRHQLLANAASLSAAWTTYLKTTSSNPTVSPEAFGSDESFIAELKETFLTGVATSIPEAAIDKIKEQILAGLDASSAPTDTEVDQLATHGNQVTDKATKSVTPAAPAAQGGDAGAKPASEPAEAPTGAAGAEVSGGEGTAEHVLDAAETDAAELETAEEAVSLTGPEVALISLAVGALIDIAADRAYKIFTGDDGGAAELRAAYEQGFTSGSTKTGDLIGGKLQGILSDLGKADDTVDKAMSARQDQVLTAPDAATLVEITARLEAQTDATTKAQPPDPNKIASRMIIAWLKDHAGTSANDPAKDVYKDQYMEAFPTLGHDPKADPSETALIPMASSLENVEAANYNDSPFIQQCFHEWSLRNLPPPPGFQDLIKSHAYDTPPDPAKFAAAFNNHKFSWDGAVDDVWGDKGDTWVEGILGKRPEGASTVGYLVEGFAVINDAGYMTSFNYVVRAHGETGMYVAEPGDQLPKPIANDSIVYAAMDGAGAQGG